MQKLIRCGHAEEDGDEMGAYEPYMMDWHNRAILDLGSNSLRMLIIRVNSDLSFSEMTHLKQMVRLGEGAFKTGLLGPEPMERTIAALKEFARRCRDFSVSGHTAYATAAVRDARNGEEFVSTIRRETGYDFRIIGGEEEARLIGLGVASELPSSHQRRLVVDVGGGSTELAVLEGRQPVWTISLKAGAVRFAEQFISGSGPVPQELYEAMKSAVRAEAGSAFSQIREYAPVEMIASSGSAKCLARMQAEGIPGEERDGYVTDAGLKRMASKLCSYSEADRCTLRGMNARRSGIIIPGAAILETVMEESGFAGMKYSKRGLREGMVIEYLEGLRLKRRKISEI